jgi:hypothetical protein
MSGREGLVRVYGCGGGVSAWRGVGSGMYDCRSGKSVLDASMVFRVRMVNGI